MKAKKEVKLDFAQDGRDLADAAWETHGPASGEFLVETYDFCELPSPVLGDLEEDQGREYKEEEQDAIDAGYRERLVELLGAHIAGAAEVLEKVKGAEGDVRT